MLAHHSFDDASNDLLMQTHCNYVEQRHVMVQRQGEDHEQNAVTVQVVLLLAGRSVPTQAHDKRDEPHVALV